MEWTGVLAGELIQLISNSIIKATDSEFRYQEKEREIV